MLTAIIAGRVGKDAELKKTKNDTLKKRHGDYFDWGGEV